MHISTHTHTPELMAALTLTITASNSKFPSLTFGGNDVIKPTFCVRVCVRVICAYMYVCAGVLMCVVYVYHVCVCVCVSCVCIYIYI